MKKFDIEIETKMRLEQGQFEWGKLELEMQMKEMETKHHLLEEELEFVRCKVFPDFDRSAAVTTQKLCLSRIMSYFCSL